MRNLFLAVLFGCMTNNVFAGDLAYRYGWPTHYGTDHYSIWYGRLPPGVVPVRFCSYRRTTPDGATIIVRKACHSYVSHRSRHRLKSKRKADAEAAY